MSELTGEVGFCKECGQVVEVAVPKDDRLQWRVFEAVKQRGYVGDWLPGQFLARQAAKLAEELGELAAEMGFAMPVPLQTTIQDAADQAKYAFDHGEWRDTYWDTDQLQRVWKELADMQVVLYCAAMAVNRLLGEEQDLAQSAAEKSEQDIRRGVRSAKHVNK